MLRHSLFCVIMLGLMGAGAVWAADPVVVEEAAPAPEVVAPPEAPAEPGHELSLSYDPAATPDGGEGLQKEISVDLIDLDALREAIEAKTGPQPKVRMTLDECIQLALKQNPDIIIAGLEPQKSDADIFTAKGEFDPMLQTTATYMYASITASQEIRAYANIDALETYRTNVNSGLAGKLHLGTQYALMFSSTKEETTYGNFIEEFGGQLNFTLTQPLLRGFGDKVNTVRIRMAKNARKMTEAQLRLTVMSTVSEVVKMYWDLVGAVENVKVREEALANAERLLGISETRRRIGTAADIEVLQAKAGVATRQSELIASRSQMQSASDLLKQILNLRDGVFFAKATVVPVDRPTSSDTGPFDPSGLIQDVDAGVALALQNRPELEIADLQIENAGLDQARARNDMLPQFDLTASYGQGGRDHYLSHMLIGIRNQNEQYYSYGFKATVPIGNRAGRGAYQRAKLTAREMEERRKKAEQAVMMGVHLATRNAATNRVLVESNGQARRLQEANVVAEEKRLRLGVTTSWQVLQVQSDLTAAQTLEVQAKTAYEKALVELELAKGTLLEHLGVQFEVPESEKPVSYIGSLRPRWE